MTVREAWLLFGMFWAQFIVGGLLPEDLHVLSRIGVGAIVPRGRRSILVRDRERMRRLFRDGFRARTRMAAATKPRLNAATALEDRGHRRRSSRRGRIRRAR